MNRTSIRPALALSLALRGLVRDPMSSTLAVTILALGIALPTTFLSFLVGAARPLPVPEGERVVRVDLSRPAAGGGTVAAGSSDVQALQGLGAFEGLGGFRVFEGTLVDPERAAARFSGAVLTPQVLPLLRVAPALGRVPAAEEAGSTVLLGHALWQEVYAGDGSAVGRTIEVAGRVRTVVGVLPEGFGFPFKQELWILAEPSEEGPLELVGRLTAGATTRGAAAEVEARWASHEQARDPGLAAAAAEVRPYTGGRGEGGETVAFVGLLLVGVSLLLIACANVANLLLVRATERVRALGVQAALGATRAQIAAQLVAEAALLAAAGGAAGLVLAWWAISAVQRALAAEHFGYFWMRLGVDGPLVAAVAGLVATAALAAGTLPVLRVARLDIQRVLKEEGRAAAAMGGGGSWSGRFVTLQLGLSCGCLVIAGLTGASLAVTRDYGSALPARETLLAQVDLRDPVTGVLPEGRRAALADRLTALPGAAGATLALAAPGYMERFSAFELSSTGKAEPDRGFVQWNAVDPGFFALMDLEVRAGRSPGPTDVAGAERVAWVSESLVRRQGLGTAALGSRVRLPSADTAAWFTVVGVVEDAVLSREGDLRPERIYVPLAQVGAGQVLVLARARGDGASLAPALRAAVAEVDPEIPVWGVRTLADGHAFMIRVPRALALMAAAGGLAGLLVASVGLYGLLAFRVRQRRREMGIRLALGADGRRLAAEVLGTALRQLVPAVVVGLALAWLAAPVLSAFLLGTDPRSPGVFAGVALGFLGMGVASALLPALRAGSVDPAEALRSE